MRMLKGKAALIGVPPPAGDEAKRQCGSNGSNRSPTRPDRAKQKTAWVRRRLQRRHSLA
jgi:hypothetical protein